MMAGLDVHPRVNLYLFQPHPLWEGVSGSVGVAARDFQRAEKIAIAEAQRRGIPGDSFSILQKEIDQPEQAIGSWSEMERYRDVEDTERLVFFTFSQVSESVQ